MKINLCTMNKLGRLINDFSTAGSPHDIPYWRIVYNEVQPKTYILSTENDYPPIYNARSTDTFVSNRVCKLIPMNILRMSFISLNYREKYFFPILH